MRLIKNNGKTTIFVGGIDKNGNHHVAFTLQPGESVETDMPLAWTEGEWEEVNCIEELE